MGFALCQTSFVSSEFFTKMYAKRAYDVISNVGSVFGTTDAPQFARTGDDVATTVVRHISFLLAVLTHDNLIPTKPNRNTPISFDGVVSPVNLCVGFARQTGSSNVVCGPLFNTDVFARLVRSEFKRDKNRIPLPDRPDPRVRYIRSIAKRRGVGLVPCQALH